MKKNTNLFSLKNKVVLITGAGRGIGKYLAEQIVKQDAIVFSIDKKCLTFQTIIILSKINNKLFSNTEQSLYLQTFHTR